MTAPTPVRAELFGSGRAATTIGILLLISLIAFESMGVGTAMPAVVDDLGGVALYAWPFVIFMAAAVFGTVLGGRWCDRSGPRVALLVAPLVFGVGLVVAGVATGMPQLLVGRVLQGLGAGVQGVAVYVLIAQVYPPHARPAVFGAVSSAWVLPSLIGPPVAGLVTDLFSWHWVFLGLVPIMAIAVALVVPAVRQLTPPTDRTSTRGRVVVLAAFGAAAGVAALSWASQEAALGVVAAVVAVAALVVLVPSLRLLAPRGTFRARRGVPAVVASRGLLAGAFFTINSYLPLMLHDTHGWSLSAAGIPLIVGSLGWSAASAWQGRHPDLSRTVLLRIGFGLLAVGTAGMLLVAPTWGIAWLAAPFWLVAGVGMGLGFSSMSFLLLAHSASNQVGFNSAAAQIADQLMVALMIGLGGALLTVLIVPSAALPVLLVVLVGLAVAGLFVAGRTAQRGTDDAASGSGDPAGADAGSGSGSGSAKTTTLSA